MLKLFKKRQGQIQFKAVETKYEVSGDRRDRKEGYVFIEAAKCFEGQDKCDWENKLLFKLGEGDIVNILTALKNKTESQLVHTFNDKTSGVDIKKGTGDSYSITIKNQGKNNVFMYVSLIEQNRIIYYLENALRLIYS